MHSEHVNVYKIDAETGTKSSTWDELLHGRAADDGTCFWADIFTHNHQVLETLVLSLGLSDFSLENALSPETPIGVVPMEGEIFIQLARQSSWKQPLRSRIAIVCIPGVVLTVHTEATQLLSGLGARLLGGVHLRKHQTSAIVHEIFDTLVDDILAGTLEARAQIDQLESVLEEEDPETLRTRILGYRRDLSRFEIGAEYLRKCVASTERLRSKAFDATPLRSYYLDLLGHLDHALRMSERMEDRLSALHDHTLLMMQSRTHRRLNLLTTLSAIFMPLTLITGIYGMNFDHMPELAWRLGYPLVLLAMGLIASVMLLFFKWKGWFR